MSFSGCPTAQSIPSQAGFGCYRRQRRKKDVIERSGFWVGDVFAAVATLLSVITEESGDCFGTTYYAVTFGFHDSNPHRSGPR